MKVKNSGPDTVMFGIHLANGAVITLPVSLETTKRDLIVQSMGGEYVEPLPDMAATVRRVAAEDGEQPEPVEPADEPVVIAAKRRGRPRTRF